MCSSIRFFATRNDVLPVLESVEMACPIDYVQFGATDAAKAVKFPSVHAIPNLGIASSDSAINCATYLICKRGYQVQARAIRGRYLFDQLLNPETVTFTPAGLWGGDILLHGRFATTSASSDSAELMKRIGSAVRSRFEKIKAFYVGREAAQMLGSGKRLAIAVQSPQTLDLSRT